MNTNSVTVVPVENKKDLNNFIKVPWKIYKNDPHWVPPLISQMKANLDQSKHPFFEHSEADLFIAKKTYEFIE